MRLIEGKTQLPFPPRSCLVTGREDGPFIDFQVVIDRPEPTRLYLKTEIVEEAGKLVGMVPKKRVEELEDQLAEMRTGLENVQDTMKLTAELEELVGRERTAA